MRELALLALFVFFAPPSIALGAPHHKPSTPTPTSTSAPTSTSTPTPTSSSSSIPLGARPGMRRLSAADVERTAREAIAASAPKLPKNARVTAIRCAVSPEVPADPTRLAIEVTPPPRRAGPVAAVALLVFYKDEAIAARVPVTLDLDVPPGSELADVAKGSTVTLVVSRGLVEVSTQASTSTDADIGDVVQVVIKPAGRALRARIVAKDRALAIEDGT
jgi:hypothetical protein